jgi:signal transduction histidine kinase
MRGWIKEELVEKYSIVPPEELFNVVVQDIRNRLSGILGYTSILDSFNVKNASDYVAKILENVADISAIIDAGLDSKNKAKP